MRFIGLLVVLLLSALSGAAAAAVPAGTDLVFLIDQSGSMMGQGATRTANDPLHKRIDAIKQLETHLVESAHAGFVNRFSVIEFGGRNARNPNHRANRFLPRQEIPAAPPGQSRDTTAAGVHSALSPIASTYRGDTDIARATALAQVELDYYKQTPPPLGPGAKAGDRKRLVVLVTDGAAMAERVDDAAMKREIQDWTARLGSGADMVSFVVFGFNDGDSNYWKGYWGKFWSGVVARDPRGPGTLAFLIDKDEDAARQIGEVLRDLIQPGAAGSGGDDTYSAPPYLKALGFTIDYDKPHLPPEEIAVTDPLGNRLPLDEQHETYATIELVNPPPGQYRLRTARSPYRVQVHPLLAAAKLSAPAPSVAQFSAEAVRYQLEGRGPGGRFLPQSDLPAVRFETVMDEPGGNREIVPLAFDPGTGDVVSRGPHRFDRPGRYRLVLTGTTKAQDGTEVQVYTSDDVVEVTTATPVQAEFLAPTAGAEFMLTNGAVDVPVTVRFRDQRTGAQLPLAEVLAPGTQLRVGYTPDEAAWPTPSATAAPVPLVANGATLMATLPIDFGGARFDLLRGEAILHLFLGLPADPWRSGMAYAGIAGTNDQTRGPAIRITESPLVLWLAGVVTLALLLGGVLFWRLFMIRWLIERGDRKYQRHPKLTYSAQREPQRCAKEWPLRGVRVVREPRVVELADGTPWSIDKFEIKRLPRPGHRVAVQLSYRPMGAKKGRLKLILEAASDSMSPRSRHTIVGLPNNEVADFVLLMGRSDR